ncbi:MAG: aminodeoxychorismate/anthranilate synthase component II [Acidimicrobiales bacterium]
MMLLLDNYDSFTFNLAHLFGALGTAVFVVRNDEIDACGIEAVAPDFLVISPGPGRPSDRPDVVDLIRRVSSRTPTLGVCLGHQMIVEAFGGAVGYARELVHGKARPIRHNGTGLFEGAPDPLVAGRYHSLAVTELPKSLEETAHSDDGEVMAVRHRALPIVGVQFHPESVLTPDGSVLAQNFLKGNL